MGGQYLLQGDIITRNILIGDDDGRSIFTAGVWKIPGIILIGADNGRSVFTAGGVCKKNAGPSFYDPSSKH